MLLYPSINPIAFSLGPLKVHWYGLMYAVGFIGAWLLASYRAKKPNSGWTVDEVSDLLFYTALGVILGGRVGYMLFYDLGNFLSHPWIIFQVWQGGMSFHGGLLGVLIAFYLYSRKTGKHFFDITDFAAPFVPIGLGAGRIGNFINGELWGRVTDVPWAMIFPNGEKYVGEYRNGMRNGQGELTLANGRRADIAAKSLGARGYRIKRISINASASFPQPRPLAR